MYSPLIVDRALAAYTKRTGFKPRRYLPGESISRARDLDKRHAAETPLTAEDRRFIRSETVLARLDFRYFAERYGYGEIDSADGGGIGPSRFWPSQIRALELIAKREEYNHAEFAERGFGQGILGVWHKTRQQGATDLLRKITAHRLTFYKHTRAITASLDGDKIHELYRRDKIWYDHLPCFLKPEIEFDVKDQHVSWNNESRTGMATTLLYQQANQQAGIGTSQQFDLGHMTEVSLWDNPWRLEFDYMPTIPHALNAFNGWESTANGRGEANFWHSFTESVRRQEEGYGAWIYVFTPCYINASRNRLPAPGDWRPNPVTQQQAELIERTSAEFAGTKVWPSRDHLYWWESEYLRSKRLGTLHMFLTNYPATPEQSFQHSERAALSVETLEWLRATSMEGMPYEMDVKGVGVLAT